MENLEQAVERIRNLECPTGEVQNRIAGILEDFGLGNKSDIIVKRNKNLDRDEAHGYVVQLPGQEEQSVVVLARAGMDDYVAKVVDAYIH